MQFKRYFKNRFLLPLKNTMIQNIGINLGYITVIFNLYPVNCNVP